MPNQPMPNDLGPNPPVPNHPGPKRMDPEEYVEAVLCLVEQIPPGRATTYGALAEAVGVGGPRQVGRVMSTYGGPVPWWRVVRADGRLPLCHDGEALAQHRQEGTPLRDAERVDLARAMWWPQCRSDLV